MENSMKASSIQRQQVTGDEWINKMPQIPTWRAAVQLAERIGAGRLCQQDQALRAGLCSEWLTGGHGEGLRRRNGAGGEVSPFGGDL